MRKKYTWKLMQKINTSQKHYRLDQMEPEPEQRSNRAKGWEGQKSNIRNL